MTLTLTIDDPGEATRMIEAVCTATKYDPGSGLTKADWVRQHIATMLKVYAKRGEFKVSQTTINTEIEAINIH